MDALTRGRRSDCHRLRYAGDSGFNIHAFTKEELSLSASREQTTHKSR